MVVCFVTILQEFHHRFRVQTVSASSTTACFLGGIRTLSIFLPDNDKMIKMIIIPQSRSYLHFLLMFFLEKFPCISVDMSLDMG